MLKSECLGMNFSTIIGLQLIIYSVEENNLLDFGISNNHSIPKLNNFNHHEFENQFASFIHKSIKLKESEEIGVS